jgi:hypothetical protein
MVIPREQKEFVLTFKSKRDFMNAFILKYAPTMNDGSIWGRINTLWQFRDTYANEIAELKRVEQERNHTVMIPARIVSKHSQPRDSIPDVGEILIRTNHLLAELLQVQKEQLTLFGKLAGDKK